MGDWKTIGWQGTNGVDVFKTAVILAEIMAENGCYVQAFPDFRQAINCATDTTYNRVSEQPIRIRSQVEKADIIVVLKPASGRFQWQQLAHEGTIYIFNCDSLDAIKKYMDIEGKSIFYVDADSINGDMDNSNPSISLLSVVVSHLGLITVEKFTEDLDKILSKQYNTDQVSAYIKSVNQALAGIKHHE